MSTKHIRGRARVIGGVVVAAACAWGLGAAAPMQPQPEPKAAGQPEGPARPVAREELKQRLQKRLAEAKEAQKRMEEALAALDRGATRDEIAALLPRDGLFRMLLERGEDGEARGPMQNREGRRGPRVGEEGPGEGFGPERGAGEGPGDRRGMNREITDEDREVIREVLRHAAPEMLSKIDELMEKDPEAGKRKIGEMFPRMRWMIELRERDEKVYRLRLSDLELARRSLPLAKEILDLRSKGTAADDPGLKAKSAELRGLIGQQFENREKAMRAEAEGLRRRADERDREIERMSGSREQIIDRLMEGLIKHAGKPGRMEDMLGPGPGRGGPEGGPGGPREGRGERSRPKE
ncbi:MAG: hypothetical protein AB7G11_13800 [Phycisphaerales bacterium]